MGRPLSSLSLRTSTLRPLRQPKQDVVCNHRTRNKRLTRKFEPRHHPVSTIAGALNILVVRMRSRRACRHCAALDGTGCRGGCLTVDA